MTKVKNGSIGTTFTLLLSIFLTSCSADERRDENEQSTFDSRDSVDATSSARNSTSDSADIDDHRLIVPGMRIGQTRIGQSLEEVNSILGEPDSGDAAMGHVWQYRRSRGSRRVHELDIYATFDSLATGHYVRLIRITSPWFTTNEGVGTGSSFDAVKQSFPKIEPIARYRDGRSSYVVYDAAGEGIAFEFMLTKSGTPGECTAIVVHEVGREIRHIYSQWSE